jgi:putative ABC transport system permease protein
VAAAQWLEWQKQTKSFEAIAAYGWTFNFLLQSDSSESIEGMAVTKDYFRLVGLEPQLGARSSNPKPGPRRRR